MFVAVSGCKLLFRILFVVLRKRRNVEEACQKDSFLQSFHPGKAEPLMLLMPTAPLNERTATKAHVGAEYQVNDTQVGNQDPNRFANWAPLCH